MKFIFSILFLFSVFAGAVPTVYISTGKPAKTLGNIDDQYKDTDTGIVYVKTDYGTWTSYVAAVDSASIGADLISDAIADSETTKAPTQNAVYDALALKANIAGPTLTGETILSRTSTSGFSNFLTFSNESDTVPQISWTSNSANGIRFTDGSVYFEMQDTGSMVANNFNTTTGYIQIKNAGQIDMRAGDGGTIPLIVKAGAASPSGPLVRFKDSSDNQISQVTSAGAFQPPLVTADPCGDTTGFPEGALWWNDTSNYYCTCVAGADKKVSDTTVDCF